MLGLGSSNKKYLPGNGIYSNDKNSRKSCVKVIIHVGTRGWRRSDPWRDKDHRLLERHAPTVAWQSSWVATDRGHITTLSWHPLNMASWRARIESIWKMLILGIKLSTAQFTSVSYRIDLKPLWRQRKPPWKPEKSEKQTILILWGCKIPDFVYQGIERAQQFNIVKWTFSMFQ